MKWLERLQQIDRRIIYTFLWLVLLVPLFRPIGIPLEVNQTTQRVYDMVEALDPAQDIVLFVTSYQPGGGPDVHPQALIVAEHLAKRKIRTVLVAFVDSGAMFAEQVLEHVAGKYDFVYGTDFVNLGFLAGMETAIKDFADAPSKAFTQDFRNNAVASLPIMAGIEQITDFSLIIDFQSGTPGYNEFLRQVQGPYGVNYAAGIVTVSVPNIMPFYSSGQVSGLLQGLRGAAEYEILLGSPGAGAAKMDAQSLGHMVIVFFIVIGNVAHLVSKKASST